MKEISMNSLGSMTTRKPETFMLLINHKLLFYSTKSYVMKQCEVLNKNSTWMTKQNDLNLYT